MATWFSCSRKSARGQHVKLVFPGGHVELLDCPTLAADVMARHPRFCVARPDVFREPAGAVAAPDAVLQLGDKYYVVPCSTVRRLQKYSAAASSASRGGGGGRRRGGSGSVTLKRHLAGEKGYKVGGRRWFRCLAGGSGGAQAQSQRPRESVGRSGKAEMARKVDVKETDKENGKAPAGGWSPGRRRRRGASPGPGNSASYSWQPSLHSITEE